MKNGKPNLEQGSNWWVDTKTTERTDLWASFTSEQTIKGLVITALNTQQMLESMNIQYSINDEEFSDLENVKFVVDKKNLKTFVKFANPIKVKTFIFDKYVGVGNPRYIDMADIEFYK